MVSIPVIQYFLEIRYLIRRGFIRHPFNRLVSAYNEKLATDNAEYADLRREVAAMK